MIAFLRSRIGMTCAVLFFALMAFMAHRISRRAGTRPDVSEAAPVSVPQTQIPAGIAAPEERRASERSEPKTSAEKPSGKKRPDQTESAESLQHTLSQLDQMSKLSRQSRTERDRTGQPVTRRKTASPVSKVEVPKTSEQTAPSSSPSSGLRLLGKSAVAPVDSKSTKAETGSNAGERSASVGQPDVASGGGATKAVRAETVRAGEHDAARLARFVPYGRPVKCELVFTLDSTLEETPVVALVVEPVHNNGILVLPAGAELHGKARPDRLRDRLFSAREWTLILPREGSRPNGCQLPVAGYALDRDEPEGRGDTWGITDGSFGFLGQVIRTQDEAELRMFAATFLSSASLGLREREGGVRGGVRSIADTPGNAALDGTASTLEQVARRIGEEIARHGVFVRVPAGKQFYFYPLHAIVPDLAAPPREAIQP